MRSLSRLLLPARRAPAGRASSARSGALRRAGRTAAAAVAAGVLALAAPASARAQGEASIADAGRWRAWLGCWTPAEAPVGRPAPLTCVVPAANGNGVEILAVGDGRVVSRERLDASGRRARDEGSCRGWDSADWSSDGRRVHLRTELTCDGGGRREGSGILAFSPDGDWIEIRGMSMGRDAGLRVTRYRDAGLPNTLPSEVLAALPPRLRGVIESRLAMGSTVSADEVIETVKQVDAAVVEAWLAQRGQPFDLDGRRLVALADAGVPSRVIDVMVAVSNPKVFALNPNTRESERRALAQGPNVRRGNQVFATMWDDPWFSPMGWGGLGWNAWNRFGGWGWDPLGFNSLGWGRLGLNRFGGFGGGWGGWGWLPGSAPIVIVNRGETTDPALRPRATRGGYTQGGATGGGAVPRTSGDYMGGASRGASSGGYSGGASAGSGASSGGGERTAKPRP